MTESLSLLHHTLFVDVVGVVVAVAAVIVVVVGGGGGVFD